MRIQGPPQISTNPQVNEVAQGWGQLLVDSLQQLHFSRATVGIATVTWPGGQAFSTTSQVPHGHPANARPFFYLSLRALGMSGLTAFPVGAADVGTTGNMQVQAWTIDNQSPAAASSADFYWLALS